LPTEFAGAAGWVLPLTGHPSSRAAWLAPQVARR